MPLCQSSGDAGGRVARGGYDAAPPMPYATRADRNAWFKRKNRERRDAGLCRRCDRERVGDSPFCPEHLEHGKRVKNALRARRRDAGDCLECGEPADPGKVRCRFHLNRVAKSRRVRRQNRKDRGFCTGGCGRRMGLDAQTVACRECRIRRNTAKQRQRNATGGLG